MCFHGVLHVVIVIVVQCVVVCLQSPNDASQEHFSRSRPTVPGETRGNVLIASISFHSIRAPEAVNLRFAWALGLDRGDRVQCFTSTSSPLAQQLFSVSLIFLPGSSSPTAAPLRPSRWKQLCQAICGLIFCFLPRWFTFSLADFAAETQEPVLDLSFSSQHILLSPGCLHGFDRHRPWSEQLHTPSGVGNVLVFRSFHWSR